MGKLFIQLFISTIFHFYGNPERKLIKSDDSHYIAPEGRRSINPFTLVFEDPIETKRKSIFDSSEGEPNERNQ